VGSLISICVCTHQRLTLQRTLESLAQQELPAHSTAELIVVDNDKCGAARTMVERAARTLPFPLEYVIEARKGISLARNAALDRARGDWLGLIDDDQVAAGDWLLQLYTTALHFRADAVIGSVRAAFAQAPAAWVTPSRAYDFSSPPTGTPLSWADARTGGALLRASLLRVHGLRFDPAYNATGGEDTDFFRRVSDLGGLIVSCQEARVEELVPTERMTLHHVRKLALQQGQVYARVVHRHDGARAAVAGIGRAVLNLLGAAVLAGAYRLCGREAHHHYRFLLLRNLGKLKYYAGTKPVQLYD
jgi:succinoglycan biosynthesis protein ExoM